MNRQKSILSFLHKPSPLPPRENQQQRPAPVKQDPLDLSVAPVKGSINFFPGDVRGTHTPPEKPPRHSVFCSASGDDSDSPLRPFASIMRKFERDDESGSKSKRNEEGSGSFQPNKYDRPCASTKFGMPSHHGSANFSTKEQDDVGSLPQFSLDFDILGPETPTMKPFVPRFKRIQEDNVNSAMKLDSALLNSMERKDPSQDLGFGNPATLKRILKDSLDSNVKSNADLLNSNKRMKALDTSGSRKPDVEATETGCSKFEWLNPSSIRDANRWRPDEPLYDKRTLYIPPDALKKMSASQKQYWSVKCQYMDVVLFFKVGKFYELYELDAEIGHRELDWKMTISGVGKCRQVGISEAGIDDAVQKLVTRGYKVGRIEQFETADQAKARGGPAVIERKLAHIYTPSTPADGSMGPDAVHLLALKEESQVRENGRTSYGFAFLDYAALRIWVGSMSDDGSYAALGALLMQVSPKEVIYEEKGLSKETHKALLKYASAGSRMQLTPVTPCKDYFDAFRVKKLVEAKGYFRGSPNGWASAFDSVMHHDLVASTLGSLIAHLCRLMLDDALRNGELLPYHVHKSCLRMDGQTLINLEIFNNNVDGGLSGTLYKHLDHCITPSGKRLLRRWICHPLKDFDEINDRLSIVEGLTKNLGLVSIIMEYLRRVPDLERLLGRIKASVGSSAALLLPLIGERILKQRVKAFGSLIRGLRIGIDLLLILQKEDHQISSLSNIVGLPMLNGLHELLKQFEASIDDDFPNYKDHDVKDSDAETLSVLIELFVGKGPEWSQLIHALNCIDVLHSFSVTATSSYGSMSRPSILPANPHSQQNVKRPFLRIRGLWHPYAVGENGNIVSNDIYLGEDFSGQRHPCTLLLTGPNMGGKSTLLRATCLAVIMAQLGSYVPCDMCELSPADIIFTRLGATDRIMSGESTFFVECAETASVLQYATQDSLVLLDELGRGTSTFDGYAIAYAVFRHLVEKVGCRLLFATHYHPLTKEFSVHPHVSLQHMACAFNDRNPESGQKDLVFLYRLANGACPESYGLQVALMAGIPKAVTDAASKAAHKMKLAISRNFKASEGRSNFSTLHEEWFTTLLTLSKRTAEGSWDEDTSDTLLCLWHEMKSLRKFS